MFEYIACAAAAATKTKLYLHFNCLLDTGDWEWGANVPRQGDGGQ